MENASWAAAFDKSSESPIITSPHRVSMFLRLGLLMDLRFRAARTLLTFSAPPMVSIIAGIINSQKIKTHSMTSLFLLI